MLDVLKRILSPPPKQSIFRYDHAGRSSVSRVFGGVLVCFIVTGLLSSGRLVSIAERQGFGDSRDRWLTAANAVDRTASLFSLDRPADAIDGALGRAPVDSTVILGELALTRSSSVSTTTSTTQVRPPPIPTTTSGAGPSSVDASTSTVPPTTTTTAPTTTTTVQVLGTVDVNSPLRVWVGGDSLGEYIGTRLLYRVVDTDLTTVELDFQISSGLARPDYFDWPGRISELMQREDRPQVVVFMAGGNDDQDMRTPAGRLPFIDEEWVAEYRERVATMMDITAYTGTQMVWINLPPMRDEKRDDLAANVNRVLAEEASTRPWVLVADIVPMFTGPNGGYEQFLTEPGGDKTIQARANDGVHITSSASEWVARQIWRQITPYWEFDAVAAATPATSLPAPGADGNGATGDGGSAGSTTSG